MPPKPKVTRDIVLEAALGLLREEGMNAVNARNVAKKLGTSTQPIFSHFASMEELREAICAYAEHLYNTAMLEAMQGGGNGFLEMGLAYIRFARTEKKLFQLLFISSRLQQEKVSDIAGSTEGDDQVIAMIGSMTGLSADQARQLYSGIWFTTHGIASLVATNGSTMDDAEARAVLGSVFKGLLAVLQKEGEAL
ncbi:TetR family transcriptional regulator [Paenibacillus faecis]|uniref:TetR/AcrR family transcriptional regulator n=1 Tax=Paenibacillus faecis TaxID=862114 RepID=UPI001B2343DC|nr:TetR/AcrR family transcriptional regulator [Paenibacillus faecis]GIO86164.1 TetR family transcriptional regulator [Paenibacillus faecis]